MEIWLFVYLKSDEHPDLEQMKQKDHNMTGDIFQFFSLFVF